MQDSILPWQPIFCCNFEKIKGNINSSSPHFEGLKNSKMLFSFVISSMEHVLCKESG